jgi:Tfp pilus assembly protein PilF
LEINAKSVEALTGLASSYEHLGKKDEAQKNFAAALAIDPNNVPALIARAEAAERWGDRKLAIESYSAAIRLNGMQLKPRQALQRLGVETPP